jgi:hypothetical protein
VGVPGQYVKSDTGLPDLAPRKALDTIGLIWEKLHDIAAQQALRKELTTRMQETQELASKSSLDGLWLVLVDGAVAGPTFEGRVPMMAKAGDDQTYLLGFKNMLKARKFLSESSIENAEPRLVVRGNRGDFLNIARASGAAGVLVDYDLQTQEFAAAAEIF